MNPIKADTLYKSAAKQNAPEIEVKSDTNPMNKTAKLDRKDRIVLLTA